MPTEAIYTTYICSSRWESQSPTHSFESFPSFIASAQLNSLPMALLETITSQIHQSFHT
jgi:hypothetical protein